MAEFGDKLRDAIQTAYEASGNTMGWRFLYSPEDVLNGASVAFVGQNPGGIGPDASHGEFAMKDGSAYLLESWAGAEAGNSPLQIQVLSLFKQLNVSPEKVLAGNLVPFRSRDWKSLVNKKKSLEFGLDIWKRIFERLRPDLIIAMGRVPYDAISSKFGKGPVEIHPLSWGRVCARSEPTAWGSLVQLPHLSRFRVVTREKSKVGLREAFGTRWAL